MKNNQRITVVRVNELPLREQVLDFSYLDKIFGGDGDCKNEDEECTPDPYNGNCCGYTMRCSNITKQCTYRRN